MKKSGFCWTGNSKFTGPSKCGPEPPLVLAGVLSNVDQRRQLLSLDETVVQKMTKDTLISEHKARRDMAGGRYFTQTTPLNADPSYDEII